MNMSGYTSPASFGLKPMPQAFGGRPAPASATGLQGTVDTRKVTGNEAAPWDPENPLFWFGLIAATTFGAIGATFSAKIGPFRGSVGAGKV